MNAIYYVLSVNGLLFIFSIIFYFFPPKKINSIYGYRTNKSMLNENIWKFANKCFNKQFLIYSSISFVVSMMIAYLNPDISWQPMAIMILSLAIPIIKTEQELSRNFNEKGKRIKRKK